MSERTETKSKLAKMLTMGPGKIAVLVELKPTVYSGLVVSRDVARSIHEERHTQGEVIAMGEELMEDEDRWFEVGDIVVFGKFSGTKLTYQPEDGTERDREEVIVLMEKDILCKLNVVGAKVGVKT
jgi:co-chaperonin GroES (HSP10)